MHAADYEGIKGLLTGISLLIFALTGAVVLVVAVWKGRSFVAQWKELKVTVNPERLEQFSSKMDEVVKSVNNKLPEEPTLFQTVKLHTNQLKAVNTRLSKMDAKLDRVLEQVGLADAHQGERS